MTSAIAKKSSQSNAFTRYGYGFAQLKCNFVKSLIDKNVGFEK